MRTLRTRAFRASFAMLTSTTLIGGTLGFAMQMYINALRKLPVLRSAGPPLLDRPSFGLTFRARATEKIMT